MGLTIVQRQEEEQAIPSFNPASARAKGVSNQLFTLFQRNRFLFGEAVSVTEANISHY
jgi:hypothetical protein